MRYELHLMKIAAQLKRQNQSWVRLALKRLASPHVHEAGLKDAFLSVPAPLGEQPKEAVEPIPASRQQEAATEFRMLELCWVGPGRPCPSEHRASSPASRPGFVNRLQPTGDARLILPAH